MLQNPATLPIIVLRAESDELATVRTELTGGKKFYAVATHLDLYDPEASPVPLLAPADLLCDPVPCSRSLAKRRTCRVLRCSSLEAATPLAYCGKPEGSLLCRGMWAAWWSWPASSRRLAAWACSWYASALHPQAAPLHKLQLLCSPHSLVALAGHGQLLPVAPCTPAKAPAANAGPQPLQSRADKCTPARLQVSVKGSQDKGEAWYDEFCSRCPDQALRARLRAMCGVGSLRTELQAVQLNHMLRNLPAITANLSRLLHQVAAKMDVSPASQLL